MIFTKHLRQWSHLLGIQEGNLSHTEKLISALGGFIGIVLVAFINQYFLGDTAALFLTASMGASAVLLFAVPHGALSQPWPLIASHFLSALVGVTCAQLIPNELWAGALAVGLAIALMHYLRCIHPPGGATALTAVVGGPALHDLGYQFVLTPVLLNAAIILTCAVAFNALFPWRRYPAHWGRMKKQSTQTTETGQEIVSHDDILAALSEINSFVDITEDDLLLIYELVAKARTQGQMQAADLRSGGYYSNGRYGAEWAVRQIIDESSETNPAKRKVIYKTVAGAGKTSTGCITRAEFAAWAKYEVFSDDKNWQRLLPRASIDSVNKEP